MQDQLMRSPLPFQDMYMDSHKNACAYNYLLFIKAEMESYRNNLRNKLTFTELYSYQGEKPRPFAFEHCYFIQLKNCISVWCASSFLMPDIAGLLEDIHTDRCLWETGVPQDSVSWVIYEEYQLLTNYIWEK